MAAVVPKCQVCKKVHPSCGDGSNLYGRPLGFVLVNTTYDKYFHLGRRGRKTNALDTLFVGVKRDAALYGGRSEGVYVGLLGPPSRWDATTIYPMGFSRAVGWVAGSPSVVKASKYKKKGSDCMGWIFCDDRLPNREDRYLVCKNVFGNKFVSIAGFIPHVSYDEEAGVPINQDTGRYAFDLESRNHYPSVNGVRPSWMGSDGDGTYFEYGEDEIIAWQPLPEPPDF